MSHTAPSWKQHIVSAGKHMKDHLSDEVATCYTSHIEEVPNRSRSNFLVSWRNNKHTPTNLAITVMDNLHPNYQLKAELKKYRVTTFRIQVSQTLGALHLL